MCTLIFAQFQCDRSISGINYAKQQMAMVRNFGIIVERNKCSPTLGSAGNV
jgi:hypothetical protein